MFPANPPVVIEYDYRVYAFDSDESLDCTSQLNALFGDKWEEYKTKKVGSSRKLLVFLRRRKR